MRLQGKIHPGVQGKNKLMGSGKNTGVNSEREQTPWERSAPLRRGRAADQDRPALAAETNNLQISAA